MQSLFSLKGKRIWVAGHAGMVGAALVRRLEREACEVLTVSRDTLDLRRQQAVEDWMAAERPDAIFLAAARVGGIWANDRHPGEFLHDNLMIETNIIETARRAQVAKLLFLGSSCIYPRLAPQPMKEDSLLTGPLEATNQWYAIAKIAGVKLVQAYRRQHGLDFISAMPTNLYGPGDNFDLANGHVLPALLRKAHEARLKNADELVVWGSGAPVREFLHVDDCADALVFLMQNYSGEEPVNVGTGEGISIHDLAQMVADIVGFRGPLRHDTSKPDGTPRKVLDVSRLQALGWASRTALADGLASTYQWFLKNPTARGMA